MEAAGCPQALILPMVVSCLVEKTFENLGRDTPSLGFGGAMSSQPPGTLRLATPTIATAAPIRCCGPGARRSLLELGDRRAQVVAAEDLAAQGLALLGRDEVPKLHAKLAPTAAQSRARKLDQRRFASRLDAGASPGLRPRRAWGWAGCAGCSGAGCRGCHFRETARRRRVDDRWLRRARWDCRPAPRLREPRDRAARGKRQVFFGVGQLIEDGQRITGGLGGGSGGGALFDPSADKHPRAKIRQAAIAVPTKTKNSCRPSRLVAGLSSVDALATSRTGSRRRPLPALRRCLSAAVAAAGAVASTPDRGWPPPAASVAE